MPIFESIRQRGGDSCYFPMSMYTPGVSVGTAFIRGAQAHKAPHITISHCHSSTDLVRKEIPANLTKGHKLTSTFKTPLTVHRSIIEDPHRLRQ